MESAPESAQPRPIFWMSIYLGTLAALGPLAIDMYLPSLPSIGQDLHASSGQTQATVAAFLAGMAIGQFVWGATQPVFGAIADKYGSVKVIIAGTVLLALGMALRNVLRQRTLSAPVVLGIDDLQWLDVESGLALEFALRRLAGERVYVVATASVI